MGSAPDVIPITAFRRDAARIIQRMGASGTPVYVTQNGRLAAVLLAREAYESLLHRLAVQGSNNPGDVDPPAGRDTGTPLRRWNGDRPELVATRFGRVDSATAEFLAAEGFGDEPAAEDG